jgi:hypothetical protein
MEMEKAKENGAKIFCIYFQNKDSNYDFGNIKGKSLEILKEISKLGETKEVYDSDSLQSLYSAFYRINEAIETNYRLKLKK